MLLNLSKSEKKAVARILLDIAFADNVLTKEETAFLVIVANALEISVDEVKASTKMSVTKCISIIRGMNLADKAEIGKLMIAMMAVDGHVDKNEVDLIAAACVAADIPIPKV